MKKFILILLSITSAELASAQFLLGPAGGVTISDVAISEIRVSTDQQINPAIGLEFTYIAKNNKPGVKLMFTQLSYGFDERTNTEDISFTNTGYNFQFRSYLFFPIKKFRVSIEAGPALSYFNRPKVSPSQANSVLPDFTEDNLNKFMVDIVAGMGLAQPIGDFTISAHSVFSFSVSKIYPELTSFSVPLSLQVWLGVQYEIFQLPKEERIYF